ncbi:MAG: prolipoprotein diacylglyceryl transferase [Chloroflexi bacterium]|nr:prolipoprotein diacylglyceryl transferase [Chloroflexota bacterium]MBU1751135.1 prolipoprotein diacylglyceryl transferase [Chloroflexota bacterium]MBU1877740.1 prolipoprotein diacylglyceryl transferase [Chloroflexota bacterium]
MLPALHIGPWEIHTYATMIGLAVIVVGLYAFHRLRQLDLPPGVIMRGGAPIFLGGLLGGLLGYYIPRLPSLVLTGTLGEGEGFSIVWGVVGAIVVAVIACRHYQVSPGRAFDLGVVPCPLGQAIARLGCLAAGCCGGLVTDSWLGVYMPDATGLWAVRYPTQLMHSAANLLIFFVLLAVERYGLRRADKPAGSRIWPFDGFLFLLFIALYFLQRFLIAFFRTDPPLTLGPLSVMHLQALVGMAVAGMLIGWNLYRSSARSQT